MNTVNVILDNKDLIERNRAIVRLEIKANGVEIEAADKIWKEWLYGNLIPMVDQAMNLTGCCFVGWMFLIQHIFNQTFAAKNKRVIHLVNAGSFLDFLIF